MNNGMKIPYSEGGRTKKWGETLTANFLRESGKTMEQWGEIVRSAPSKEPRQISSWLRKEYGLGINHIGLLLSSVFGSAWEEDPEGLVQQLFSRHREQLPVYEAVVWAGLALGEDVACSARKTMVTLVRNKQFCAMKPTPRGLAVGFACQDLSLSPMRNLGSERIVGALTLNVPADVNDHVKTLLKRAYDLS